MLKLPTQIAAWFLLACIIFWTLGPLADRPSLGDPLLERSGAYFVLGALFGLAYRRPLLIGVALTILATVLELGQLLAPGRDAGVPDAIEKVLGGAAGLCAGSFFHHLLTRSSKRGLLTW